MHFGQVKYTLKLRFPYINTSPDHSLMCKAGSIFFISDTVCVPSHDRNDVARLKIF